MHRGKISNLFGISIMSYFVVSAISSRSTNATQSNPNEDGIKSAQDLGNLSETFELKIPRNIGRKAFQIPKEIFVEIEEWIDFFNHCMDVSKQSKGYSNILIKVLDLSSMALTISRAGLNDEILERFETTANECKITNYYQNDLTFSKVVNLIQKEITNYFFSNRNNKHQAELNTENPWSVLLSHIGSEYSIPNHNSQFQPSYTKMHVDKDTDPDFCVTAIVYLNSGNCTDFCGGNLRFASPDSNNSSNDDFNEDTSFFTPERGKVVLFTSGDENPHWVEKVTRGTRKSLAFFFSCLEK